VVAPRLKLLLSRADLELEKGNDERALACADEALRQAPRMVRALRVRALALTELDRVDEARITYARALAIDPDDPDLLHGAADLYVHHMTGDRPTLLLGLEYALRGARIVSRTHPRDPTRTAPFFLVAATAENDLGENAEALSHADAVLRADPKDSDALYERGVALYELCRFREAEAALTAVLDQLPDDAWALRSLALVAERSGDLERAERLDRRARQVAPADFPEALEVDRPTFEREVQLAVASLPEPERRALREVPVEVAETPALEDLVAVQPPLSPSILGLYRGPPETMACSPEEGPRCRSIVLYRRNLLRFARNRPELTEQVRVTLLHELGHLHGESDDDLRARGLE
jgi:predicted Zn-dependent protease with MMP-like domain/Flp pilus assembly protein TadD